MRRGLMTAKPAKNTPSALAEIGLTARQAAKLLGLSEPYVSKHAACDTGPLRFLVAVWSRLSEEDRAAVMGDFRGFGNHP